MDFFLTQQLSYSSRCLFFISCHIFHLNLFIFSSLKTWIYFMLPHPSSHVWFKLLVVFGIHGNQTIQTFKTAQFTMFSTCFVTQKISIFFSLFAPAVNMMNGSLAYIKLTKCMLFNDVYFVFSYMSIQFWAISCFYLGRTITCGSLTTDHDD